MLSFSVVLSVVVLFRVGGAMVINHWDQSTDMGVDVGLLDGSAPDAGTKPPDMRVADAALDPEDDYTKHCKAFPPRHFNRYVREAAVRYNVNPRVVALTVYRESRCRAKVRGSSGEIGLGQVYPKVWSKVLTKKGIIKSVDDLYEPEVNINATAFILSEAYRVAKGDPVDALRRYNGSGERARKYARNQARDYLQLWGEEVWFR